MTLFSFVQYDKTHLFYNFQLHPCMYLKMFTAVLWFVFGHVLQSTFYSKQII